MGRDYTLETLLDQSAEDLLSDFWRDVDKIMQNSVIE
jgi:hypothetical protein